MVPKRQWREHYERRTGTFPGAPDTTLPTLSIRMLRTNAAFTRHGSRGAWGPRHFTSSGTRFGITVSTWDDRQASSQTDGKSASREHSLQRNALQYRGKWGAALGEVTRGARPTRPLAAPRPRRPPAEYTCFSPPPASCLAHLLGRSAPDTDASQTVRRWPFPADLAYTTILIL